MFVVACKPIIAEKPRATLHLELSKFPPVNAPGAHVQTEQCDLIAR